MTVDEINFKALNFFFTLVHMKYVTTVPLLNDKVAF